MTDLMVASLNIRGIPLTGSRLAARCAVIGAYFEASDADVVCLQEVLHHVHLALLARRMPSFRFVSVRRTLPGPAGDVVTFSRLPVASRRFFRFGPSDRAGSPAHPHPCAADGRLGDQAGAAGGWPWSTRIRWPTPTGTGLRRTGSTRCTAPSLPRLPAPPDPSRRRSWCAGTSTLTGTRRCSATSSSRRCWPTCSRAGVRRPSGPSTCRPEASRICIDLHPTGGEVTASTAEVVLREGAADARRGWICLGPRRPLSAAAAAGRGRRRPPLSCRPARRA